MKQRKAFKILMILIIICMSSQLQAQDVETTLTLAQQSDSMDVIKDEQNTKQPKVRDFRWTLGGGYSGRMGQRMHYSDPGLEHVSKKLMNGFNFDADGQYFFSPAYGIGLHLNYAYAQGQHNSVLVPEINLGKIHYKESNSFLFIAPSFVGKHDYNKFTFLWSLDIGPLFYTNKNYIKNIAITGTKTTAAVGFNIGMEYNIKSSLGAGLKLTMISSSTKSINLNGTTVQYPESQNLSNLSIIAYISFKNTK